MRTRARMTWLGIGVVVATSSITAAAYALSCIDTNPETTELEIVSVTVDGKSQTDLTPWQSVDTSIEAAPAHPGRSGSFVRLVVRERDNPGNWLFTEVYRGVP